ncbi:hypothetical protein ACE6H2_014858 [Prunus campanulata]
MEAEDPIDEDELTVTQLLKFRKKHENFGIIQGSDSEKLSSQAQHFASPIAQKGYVNTMKSDGNIVNLVGDECASSSSLFQKRQLELGARFERLRTMIDELKAHRLENKANVTTKYLKWWKQSLSGLEDAREAAVPPKTGTKNSKCLLSRANHPSVPPGFPPKRKRMEAGDGEKLSSQAQHFASPIAQKSYVNTMKSDENMVNLVGDERASSSSLFQKRQLELGARFERLRTMIDDLKAHRLGNKV